VCFRAFFLAQSSTLPAKLRYLIVGVQPDLKNRETKTVSRIIDLDYDDVAILCGGDDLSIREQHPLVRFDQWMVGSGCVWQQRTLGVLMVLTANTIAGLRSSSPNIPEDANHDAGTAPIRVAVVEDDERLRRALVFQLSTAGFQVTPLCSAEEFLEVPDASAFDCIVVDNFLPRMSGVELQAQLHRTVPFASIVFISGHGDLSLGMQAMRGGAMDFLEKPIDEEALLRSIIRGANSTRRRRAEHLQRVEVERRQNSLTPREREVFLLITAGLLNKQVGAELGTTERTVKAHRERVMSKMGADSLADLVRMAGILDLRTAPART